MSCYGGHLVMVLNAHADAVEHNGDKYGALDVSTLDEALDVSPQRGHLACSYIIATATAASASSTASFITHHAAVAAAEDASLSSTFEMTTWQRLPCTNACGLRNSPFVDSRPRPLDPHPFTGLPYDTIRYDREFNVDSKAEYSA